MYNRNYDDLSWEAQGPSTALILAAIAGGAVAAVLFVLLLATLDLNAPQILGGGLTAAAAIWALLCLLLLRKAGAGWMIGAFGLIVMAALLAVGGRIAIERQRAMDDLRATNAIFTAYLQAHGTPDPGRLPAARGEVSAKMRGLMGQMADDQRAYQRDVDRVGMKSLFSVPDLLRDPSILKDCGRIEAMKGTLVAYRAKHRANLARARSNVEASSLPDDFKRNFLKGFDQSYRSAQGGQAMAEAHFQDEADLFDEARGLCRVLAKRHWVTRGNNLLFTSDRDLTDYNAGVARFLAIARRQEDRQRAQMAAAREKIQALP